MSVTTAITSGQYFRHNFQAEAEIKHHALSSSILNVTGYSSIPFPDIYNILSANAPCHLIQFSNNQL